MQQLAIFAKICYFTKERYSRENASVQISDSYLFYEVTLFGIYILVCFRADSALFCLFFMPFP